MTSPIEHRRAFDTALTRLENQDVAAAQEEFAKITAASPAMSDAWLGRLAAGDHSLPALAGAHEHSRALYRETKRLGIADGSLQALVPAPLWLNIQVWNRPSITLAYASRLITAGQYDQALAVLNEPALVDDTWAQMWRQFLIAALYHRTQRWPDLLAATDTCPPRTATYVNEEVLAATQTLRALANARLGLHQPALDLIKTIRSENPDVKANLAITKGWCLRALGDEPAAAEAFNAAAVNGQLIWEARDALAHPEYQMVTTDADTIATRTDKWNPETETSREVRDAAELDAERETRLKAAQETIDNLIGLEDAKEQIAVWRTEIQIEQLLAEQGEGGDTTNENHMVFLGPPGTAKTTFARVVGEVLFGLGKISKPGVREVTEEDIVVGFVSQTAAKMKEVCEEARGGVLFIDEAYRLVPTTEGHSFGKDAINTLLKYMEDFRDELVVIVAGYPKEMQDFLRANAGLASRFHFTLTFESYTPDELVQIAQALAPSNLVVAPAAWDLLRARAAELRAQPYDRGTMLDLAGNGRWARKVVVACKRERARRMHRIAPDPADLPQLVRTDPDVLKVTVDDMRAALAASEPPPPVAAAPNLVGEAPDRV